MPEGGSGAGGRRTAAVLRLRIWASGLPKRDSVMAREKTYKFRMKDPDGKIPKDGYVSDGILIMPRLMRPKEIAKYGLTDLNAGFTKLTIYRSSVNMKQSALSEITGISVRTLQGWELRGLNEAKASSAVKIADALKCSVKELMEEE